ncbi:MAG: DUF4389 domain-containing protein [Gammaproteobacteria bacterium]|nr:DUF4389 domain-containing protein [Gammaproteobacteria bacterium]
MNDQIDTDELKENLKSQDTWLRLVFIVLYGAILWATSVVLGLVVVFQFLMMLFTRHTQESLVSFGASLAEFVRQIVAYLTFNTEEKPFPFGDWPAGNKPAAKKKAAAKKKTS